MRRQHRAGQPPAPLPALPPGGTTAVPRTPWFRSLFGTGLLIDADARLPDDGRDVVNRAWAGAAGCPANRAAGATGDHPSLNDGWRVQLFTDAAAESARRG